MNLGIFGDSWADINPAEHRSLKDNRLPWASWISNDLSAKLHCYALSGTGLWWSFENFLKNYKRFEKIVFLYTHYGRWNGLTDDLSSIAHIREPNQIDWVDQDNKDYAQKLIDVYPFLYNDDLNLFIYQQIFDEVNYLCDKYGIQLVNILAFDREQPKIKISKQKGAVLHNLVDIMNFEIDNSERLKKYIGSVYDIRHCHMNPHNNRILADIILENLTNPNILINVGEDARLSFDEKHCEYFFDQWDKNEKRH